MRTVTLTRSNEYKVLALMVCGLSAKESANYLKISKATVNMYKGRILCKFNAHSSVEVIRKILISDDFNELIKCGREVALQELCHNGLEKTRLAFAF